MIRRGQLQTSAQAKPFRQQHRAPCSDCPWARKSLKGWTGPTSVQDWLRVARDYWFKIVCHTRKKASGEHWECAGAAIYRANIGAHHYGNSSNEGHHLLKIAANRITVFASPQEFENHHDKGGK